MSVAQGLADQFWGVTCLPWLQAWTDDHIYLVHTKVSNSHVLQIVSCSGNARQISASVIF